MTVRDRLIDECQCRLCEWRRDVYTLVPTRAFHWTRSAHLHWRNSYSTWTTTFCKTCAVVISHAM